MPKITKHGGTSNRYGEPEAESTPEPEAVTAPARSASRKVWAEFAGSLGVDVDGLTKAEIVEVVGG